MLENTIHDGQTNAGSTGSAGSPSGSQNPPPGNPGTVSYAEKPDSTLGPGSPRPDCQAAALAWSLPPHGGRHFLIFKLNGGQKEAAGVYFLNDGVCAASREAIEAKFPAGRDYNIGWRTGLTHVSNTVLIDLDVKDGRKGPDTLLSAARKAGWPVSGAGAGECGPALRELAQMTGALVARTPSGGYHFIYSAGSCQGRGHGEFSQSPALWVEEFGKGCGVDIRARHGYAAAPGSWVQGEEGPLFYEVVHEPAGGGLSEVPEFVKARLIKWEDRARGSLAITGRNGGAVVRFGGVLMSGEWSQSVVEDAKRGVLDARLYAKKGERNSKGFVVAAYLRRDMAFDYELARGLMDYWAANNCQEALPPHELDTLTRQGAAGQGLVGGWNWEALYAAALELGLGAGVGVGKGAEEVRGRGWKREDEVCQALLAEQMEWGQMVTEGRARVCGAGGSGGAGGSRSDPGGGVNRAVGVAAPLSDGDVKLTSFGAIEGRKMEWLVDGMIVEGALNIILGAGATGKSQVMLAIGAAVTHGAPIVGRAVNGGAPAEVWLVTSEDDPETTIKPRALAAGAHPDRMFYMEGVREAVTDAKGKVRLKTVMLDLERHIEQLDAKLARHPRVKLLMLDPLNAYFGKKANTWKTSDMRNLLSPFTELAQRRRITILGLMHPPKTAGASSGSTVHRAADSAAIGQVARGMWEVLNDPTDDNWEAEGRGSPRRLLINGKPNLTSQSVKGLVYQVVAHGQISDRGTGEVWPTSRVLWNGEVSKSADRVWDEIEAKKREGKAGGGGKTGRPASAKREAEDAIIRILCQQPGYKMDWAELLAELKDVEGVAEATAYRAKRDLGLVTTRCGLYTNVQLPENAQREK